MDELTIAFKIESPPSWLPIGRTAENNWRTVEIDCSYWFNMNANGEVVLMYKPSCGMSPYPLLTERDGDNIIWRPKSGELVEGVGRLQAFFEVGTDVIGSSDMISCEVDSSLLGADPGTDPGQTDLPWALDIIEQIAELSGHYPKIIDGDLYIWDSTTNDWVEFEAGGSGGGAVESVNGKTGTVVLDASDVGALPDDTPIPAAVTEQTVAGWGFTKNTGTYSKPSGGIPATDLAQAVQTSLGKADTALQQHQSLSGYATETWVQNQGYGTYSKPSGGIPTSDLDLVGLGTWLGGAGANIYTLSLSGTTVTLDKSWLILYSSLIDSARHTLFVLPIGGTTQNPVVLILSLQKADAQTYSITLGGEYNGNRYFVTLTAASATASPMTGTLVTTPLQELPAVTASDNGKVLGVVNGAWSVKTDEAGSTITVDDALPTTSTNPVQNKVVKAALDAKVDAESVESLKTGYFELPYVLSPGYLSGSGAVMNPSATQEVYTSLIPVKGGEILDINLQIGSVESSWFALCVYNSEKTFLRRTVLQNSAEADSFNINLLIPNDAVYIAFTYRSYGTAVLTVKRTWTVIDGIVKQTRNIFGSKWTRLVYNASGVLVEPGNFRNVGTLPEIPVIGGKKYTVSFGEMQYTERIFAYVEQYGADGNFIGSITTGPSFPATFTANSNAVKIGLMIYAAGTAPTDFRQIIPEWTQLEIGETATQYVNHFAIVDDLVDGDVSAKVWEQIESNVKNEISVVGSPNLTVKTIAHRGDDVLAPQCTAPSYVAARKRGIMIAENDLALSEDGQLVMWHDTSLSRLGDLVDINGYLMYTDGTNYYWVNNNSVYTWNGSSYAASSVALSGLTRCAGADYGVNSQYGAIGLSLEILKRIDFGAYKGEQFKGTQILTFAEWVLLCKQLGMECYVDKKLTYTDALIEEAANTVLQYGMGEHVSWLGLDTAKITKLREYISDARCGLLTHPTDALIQQMAPYNVGRGFFFNGDGGTMVEADIRKGLLAGFDVEVWFVGYGSLAESQILSTIRQAVSYGVTGITLDHYRVDDAFEIALNPVPAERPDGVLLSNVSQLINDSNYQTAAQVQMTIAAAAELPSGGTTGDFLRKTANGAAWQTVPSAESNSFGGGA